MNRAKSGVSAHRRHKKILKQASGYYGLRSKAFRVAKAAVRKAMQYSYRDRKCRKRYFRSLWITRINSALKQHSISYSVFMHQLKQSDLNLNRKMLADVALFNPEVMTQIVKTVQQQNV